MKTPNIRAFKAVLPDGKVYFIEKSLYGRGEGGCNSIQSLAKLVKSEVKDFLDENQHKMTQITIDLRPFHDIECPTGIIPRRCFPLTKKEQDEFWKQFNAS